MLHPSSYLAYAAWITPIVLPFFLAYAWRARIRRMGAFVLVGALTGLGITFISLIAISFVLSWLNNLLGLSLRGELYGGVPALIWFNAVVMLATSLVLSFLAMSTLARMFGSSETAPKGEE